MNAMRDKDKDTSSPRRGASLGLAAFLAIGVVAGTPACSAKVTAPEDGGGLDASSSDASSQEASADAGRAGDAGTCALTMTTIVKGACQYGWNGCGHDWQLSCSNNPSTCSCTMDHKVVPCPVACDYGVCGIAPSQVWGCFADACAACVTASP